MMQKERDQLVTELETLATTSDEQTHKVQETYANKLKELETQVYHALGGPQYSSNLAQIGEDFVKTIDHLNFSESDCLYG